MFVLKALSTIVLAATSALAYDRQLGFNTPVQVENRTLDEIYQVALKEGGTVTVWHGGDETYQQDAVKDAFEARFPGMTLNITVNLSKYHDVNLDRQLAIKNVYVDSIVLQTLNDYPRWKQEGALLSYKPLGFENIYKEFADDDGAFMGLFIYAWSNVFSSKYLNGSAPVEYTDYLKPEFKDKLVLTIPNDDDAVLYQFDLIMKIYGYEWLEALIAQNPRWVRGTETPTTLIKNSNGTYTASFTTSVGLFPPTDINITHPTSCTFTAWPQTGAILKDAPHPESAKLFHSWMLSPEHQNATGTWTVRKDIPPPVGYPSIMDMPSVDATKFSKWMSDRSAVERLRFFFEDRLGPAMAISPLDDDL